MPDERSTATPYRRRILVIANETVTGTVLHQAVDLSERDEDIAGENRSRFASPGGPARTLTAS